MRQVSIRLITVNSGFKAIVEVTILIIAIIIIRGTGHDLTILSTLL
jgi:hypothetical protein